MNKDKRVAKIAKKIMDLENQLYKGKDDIDIELQITEIVQNIDPELMALVDEYIEENY